MVERRVTQMARGGSTRPQLRVVARGAAGWTQKKREAFLAELAATANVRASARAVKMAESSAYALRTRDPGFREAWIWALNEGYAKLELMLLERAMKGTPRIIAGKASRIRQYSDRLALQLLANHRQSVLGERARVQAAGGGDGRDVVRELIEKFDIMSERMRLAAPEGTGPEGAGPEGRGPDAASGAPMAERQDG